MSIGHAPRYDFTNQTVRTHSSPHENNKARRCGLKDSDIAINRSIEIKKRRFNLKISADGGFSGGGGGELRYVKELAMR